MSLSGGELRVIILSPRKEQRTKDGREGRIEEKEGTKAD